MNKWILIVLTARHHIINKMTIRFIFLMLLFYCSSSIFASITPEEKEILKDFYAATNENRWDNDQNWIIAEDPCDWYGITCLENNQFEIDLSGNDLRGTLPENFANLSHLTSLKLGIIQTYGHGPGTFLNRIKLSKNFGNLPALTYLDLSQTGLEILPSSFGNLKKLTFLNLRKNQLKNLSNNFGELTELTILDLSENQLTDLPANFGNLKKLIKLSLLSNKLFSLPENFGDLLALTDLTLSHNNFITLSPSLGNLKQLRDLSLTYNNKLSSLPDNFGHLTELRNLDLANTALVTLPESFGDLKNLEILELSTDKELNNFSSNKPHIKYLISLPESFGNLKNLKDLNLSNNNLVDLPKNFSNLENLEKLDLSNNNLTNLPNNFTQLLNLKNLYLINNQLNILLPNDLINLKFLENLALTVNQLSELPQNFGELKRLKTLWLNIDISKPLSENILTHLPESFGNLQRLEKLTLQNIPLIELPESIGNLKKLSKFTLTGSQLIRLPESFINLSKSKTINLRDNQLFFIPQNYDQMILKNNPIEQLQKDSDNFMNWAESLFYDLLSPSNQTSQVFSIKDPQSPYFGYWYYRYYPETGIYLGLKPNTENTHYNIYVSGGRFGNELTFIETLPNLVKNIPQFSLSDCVPTIPFPQQGTTIEYTYKKDNIKGLLTVFIKEFNENQSIIEEQLTLSGKTKKTITTQFFSTSERGKPLRLLDKIIIESEDKITTIEYPRPSIFELESYCKGEKYVISKVVQSSNSGTKIISIPSKTLYINATNIQLILPSGTFNTIKKTISSQEEDIQIETWVDIDTGMVVVKRGSTNAGVVLYTQILKNSRS